MIGHLVKITSTKKLMVKISETAYNGITARLITECQKKGFPTTRLAVFSFDDEGAEVHFVMISLDKYNKQNMRKFEQLLKKDIAFQYHMKPYDFIPEGETEQRCGINLELISIHPVKPKVDEWVIAGLDLSKEVNAQQAIDVDKKKKMAQILLDTVLAQNEATPRLLQRRRRTPVTATPQQLTDLESAVKDLDDVIAANEQALGVSE